MTLEDFERDRLNIQARGSWLITRDASPALAFFATLSHSGTEWFKNERLKAVDNARFFRQLLQSRQNLFELLPSANTICAFVVKGSINASRRTAEIINDSRRAFISYDETLRVKNVQDLESARRQFRENFYSQYDGFWANFYPFQSEESINTFFSFLCHASQEAIKQALPD